MPIYTIFGKWRWQKKLLEDLDAQPKPVLINLASNEYFKAVDASALGNVQIINPVFKDTSNGRLKIISFFAKRARGAMANFVIKQRIKQPEQLKTFDTDGYQYQPELSTETDWVFAR